MAKVKDESKLQIQLKIDKIKDVEIFDVLNISDNKSDFIKDALFYFICHIEQGKVINRNYPYKKIGTKLDLFEDRQEPSIETGNTASLTDTNNENNKFENNNATTDNSYDDDEYDDFDDNLDDVEI